MVNGRIKIKFVERITDSGESVFLLCDSVSQGMETSDNCKKTAPRLESGDCGKHKIID